MLSTTIIVGGIKMIRTDILERKDEILEHIKNNGCKSELCKRFKCKPETLNAYLKKMGIEYPGNPNRKGFARGPEEGYLPAIHYIETGKIITAPKLRQKLIRDGLKEWNGYKIPLELHHKNGNHYDNALDNLQILCPTCHALETLKDAGLAELV